MIMKRIISKILLVLLSVFLLVSCSSPPSENDTGKKVTGTYEGIGKGRGGDITIDLTLEDSVIKSIEVKEHNETPGYDMALEELPQKMIEQNTVEVDLLSGSTLSSNGIIEAVKNALEKAGVKPEDLVKKESQETSGDKKVIEESYDVVVIGAGGAGLTAAITAKEAGANVLVLEKMPFVGGNTLISGAEYAAPANWIQEKEGIEDSPELMVQDMLVAGGSEELIRVIADNALKEALWLQDEVDVIWEDELMFFGGHSVKRSLIPKGASGREIITKLEAKSKELDIPIYVNTKATQLLQNPEGDVNGVVAEGKENDYKFTAKTVIIASGGFGSNVEMRKKYDPTIDESILSTNSTGSTGDGIIMGEEIDANLVGMEHIQLYPICDAETGQLLYMDDTRLYGFTIMVNQEGKRFVEELDTRYAISMAIKDQTGSYTYELWDHESTEKSKILENHLPEYESLIERKLMVKADTLEEAAKFFDIDPQALQETVDQWNQYVEDGKDPDFNKRGTLTKIETAPFYLMKAVPGVHHTMGGLEINTDGQVLDTNGKVIKGLYSAGEVTGGIHGNNRLGSAALADIIVFGRVTGKNAAEEALK